MYALRKSTTRLRIEAFGGTIVESSEANQRELIADIIGAISDIVRLHPRWPGLGLEWLEAFDKIDLDAIRKTGKATGVQPLRGAVMALLCVEIEKILGPAKLPAKPRRIKRTPKLPRSVTRVAEIEKSIAMGGELLALRSAISCNKKFGREVRRRFPDVDPITAAEAQRVARLYLGLDDIWRRASWQTLIELASPKMAPEIRSAFEDRILAGGKVTTVQIRRARRRLPGGSPKRALVTPAPRMAA